MIKTILQAGQIIDIATIGENQYFCVVDNTELNPENNKRELYNGETNELIYATINRYTVNSTMIILYDASQCLTDNFANFFECIKYSIILTENNILPLI